MEKILGLTEEKTMIVIGAGNLGKAIMRYSDFSENGFHIISAFDRDESKIGREIGGIEVRDIQELEEFLSENQVDIAVLTIHKDVAQKYTNICVEKGVQGFWNFAPKKLRVPKNVVVENMWLNESLYTLGYFLKDVKSGLEYSEDEMEDEE